MASTTECGIYGWQDGNHCGYCESHNGVSYGMRMDKMTASEYQALIDRGWRRSGTYVYKFDNTKTCCAAYTIRLDSTAFKLNKSQKKVLKKFERFLNGEDVQNDIEEGEEDRKGETKAEKPAAQEKKAVEATKDPLADTLSECLKQAITQLRTNGTIPSDLVIDDKLFSVTPSRVFRGLTSTLALALAPRLPQTTTSRSLAQTLCDTLIAYPAFAESPFSVEAAGPGFLNFLKKKTTTQEEETVASEKQASEVKRDLPLPPSKRRRKSKPDGAEEGIPSDKPTESTATSSTSDASTASASVSAVAPAAAVAEKGKKTLTRRKFQVKLVSAEATAEGFALYQKYQVAIHKDDPSELSLGGYKRFLCSSPITVTPASSDQKSDHRPASASSFSPVAASWDLPSPQPLSFGGYHLQYLIDDKLVAVGVVDVLPLCLSSVYLFYDPAYSFLEFGTLSALVEIEWTRRLYGVHRSLKYYYMGFYIHSCQKMKYKGRYHPSDLLCPERYTWHPLDPISPLLDISPYLVISDAYAALPPAGQKPSSDTATRSPQPNALSLIPEAKHELLSRTIPGVPNLTVRQWLERVPAWTTTHKQLESERHAHAESRLKQIRIRVGQTCGVVDSLLRRGMSFRMDLLKKYLVPWAELVGPELAEKLTAKLS